MLHLTSEQKIHFTLRIAIAMCFIGHGAFGIIAKPIWCNYFAVVGISHDLAYRMMPVMGVFDILFGLIMLVYPMRIIALWLVVWGIVTALLRPLSGEPFAELIERAGNFGAPLAFLILSGSGGVGIRRWFARIHPDSEISEGMLVKLTLCLRGAVFLLLIGHGWLNILQKKALLSQYASIGLPAPYRTALFIGLFEIFAACSVLIRPLRPILLVLFIWKMASELFYPHYEVFEWIERGGSYGSILALWFVMRQESESSHHVNLAA